MTSSRLLRAAVVAGGLLLARPAAAQDLASVLHGLGVSGSLRAGYWSSTRALDQSNPQFGGVAWVKASREITPQVKVFVEAEVTV